MYGRCNQGFSRSFLGHFGATGSTIRSPVFFSMCLITYMTTTASMIDRRMDRQTDRIIPSKLHQGTSVCKYFLRLHVLRYGAEVYLRMYPSRHSNKLLLATVNRNSQCILRVGLSSSYQTGALYFQASASLAG